MMLMVMMIMSMMSMMMALRYSLHFKECCSSVNQKMEGAQVDTSFIIMMLKNKIMMRMRMLAMMMMLMMMQIIMGIKSGSNFCSV